MKNIFTSVFNKLFKKDNLKGRLAKGGFWLGIGSGTEQLLRLIRNMIFARLILPEEMGIFVIVLAVYSLFESLSEVGIREVIIQNPNSENPAFLNAAWLFDFTRSILLYVIGFFASPFIAQFYNDPNLVPLLRTAFIFILFKGTLSPRAYLAVKKMQMHKWVLIEQLGGILGIITATILAFIYKNIWALIIGFVAEGIARTLLSYIVCPFLPRFKLDKKYFKEIMKFARGMIGLPILSYIYLRADVFVIGRIVSKTALGLYGWAANLAKLPLLLFQKLINPLIMPTFSEMQDDKAKINNTLIKITRIFALIALPLIAFFLFYSKESLSILYTPQYGTVAIPFAILFISTLLRNFNVPIVAIYFALGRPAYVRTFTLIRAIIVVVLIVPATMFFDLIGTASIILFAMIISYIIQLFYLKRFTKISLIKYLSVFIPYLLFSTLIIPGYFITSTFFSGKDVLSILIGGSILLVIYLISFIYYRKSSKIPKLQSSE